MCLRIVCPDCLDDIVTLFEFFEQFRDELRRMLQIAVHQNGCISAAVIETCNQGHLVPKPTR
jgi:hypothetical protein